MKRDPIVDEVHRIREKLLDECGGDIEVLMDRFKTLESRDSDRVVSSKSPKERPGKNKQISKRFIGHDVH
jgi:hypothetical protein